MVKTVSDNPLIYLVAGEVSGDLLGSHLMDALRILYPHATFRGVGGGEMLQRQFVSLFPMADLAVMGFFSVLMRLPLLRRRLLQTVADIRSCNPDIIITIDAPGFCHRLARRIRSFGIPMVHYVAPTVWAWKPKRAKAIAPLYDHLLCLLPFEPPYFQRHGLAATFVGHPVVETGIETLDATVFRTTHSLDSSQSLLCLLPGSRRTEASYLLPLYEQLTLGLALKIPDFRVVMPVVPHLRDFIAYHVRHWAYPPILVEGRMERYGAFRSSRVIVAASGTVSLELALAGVPSLIVYKTNPITAFIVRRLVRVRFVTLVNILSNRLLMPEYLQADASVSSLMDAVLAYWENPSLYPRDAILRAMDALYPPMGESPSQMAAHVIAHVLETKAASHA